MEGEERVNPELIYGILFAVILFLVVWKAT